MATAAELGDAEVEATGPGVECAQARAVAMTGALVAIGADRDGSLDLDQMLERCREDLADPVDVTVGAGVLEARRTWA